MKALLVAMSCKPCRGTGYVRDRITKEWVSCNVCVMTGTASVYTKLVPRRNPRGTRTEIRQRHSA